MGTISSPSVQANLPSAAGIPRGTSRQFLGQRFVYCVISQRARGLSIGINMNPDGRCNFDCIYCEVDRRRMKPHRLPVGTMVQELKEMLALVQRDLRCFECFANVPGELLKLKEVALSGDGEPTLCPNFAEIVRSVIHLRSRRLFPPFKIVLITNGSGLDIPDVRAGIDLLTNSDEVWAKLDAGTQTFMDAINRPEGVSLDSITGNIRALAQRRPVVIQSLFTLVDGNEPPEAEIEEYVRRLMELKESGAQIPLVQIYSTDRTPVNPRSTHLPLRTLSRIARWVREGTGLRAEVF